MTELVQCKTCLWFKVRGTNDYYCLHYKVPLTYSQQKAWRGCIRYEDINERFDDC